MRRLHPATFLPPFQPRVPAPTVPAARRDRESTIADADSAADAPRYELDIRIHLKPHPGHLRLDKLRVHHIDANVQREWSSQRTPHACKASDLFKRLVEASGSPPIRLHDLRHVAATLMLAAGVDIKIVSETLGHYDTRNTYQSVLDDLARDAAEKVTQLVPHARQAPSVVKDNKPKPGTRRPRMTPPRKNSGPTEDERTA